jgi:hypothetical protein
MIHHTTTKFKSPPLRGAIYALFVIIAVSPSASAAEGAQTHAPRHWTSTDGRTLKGTFVKADESKVTVRRTDSRVVDIPITQLAEEDRRLVAATIEAEQADPEVKESRQYLTYILPDGSENWDPERKKQIVASMDAAVALYNTHGVFKKRVWANNSPGTPTADANYEGWINFGGSRNTRVALHEISHTLGVGTHSNWQKTIKDGKWTGKHALKQLREFDGPDATLSADRMHFWPYGLNFDRESSPENDIRHVKMVAALRKDMGID